MSVLADLGNRLVGFWLAGVPTLAALVWAWPLFWMEEWTTDDRIYTAIGLWLLLGISLLAYYLIVSN